MKVIAILIVTAQFVCYPIFKSFSEIEFIERNGGLTERQGREYLKVMKAIGEPSVSDLTRIKNGETADQILK